MPDIPSRVARLEQHIADQNGSLRRIEGKQDSLDEKLDDLAEGLACFKGLWGAASVIFAAAIGTVLAFFSRKLG